MKCPVCGCHDNEKMFKLCDNMKIMGANFSEKSSFISKCDKCGLVFIETEDTQQEYLDYYRNEAYAPKYYDMFDKEEVDEYFGHILDLILPYLNNGSTILDIAGAWGELADYINNRVEVDMTVLDPNENCILCSKERGLKTICGDSTNMSTIPDKSFSVVILNHALEHILDVKATMNEIRRVLRDNGVVFVELPDASCYEEEEAAPFNFLTYEHVLHMSMNDLENVAAINGFSVLEKGKYYKKVSNYPSLYAILKKGSYRDICNSVDTYTAVERYISKSKACLDRFLNPLIASQEPLILWGIGASTAILMNSFEKCNVVQLVDRNSRRQGIEFRIGHQTLSIVDPKEVGNGTIVVLSIPYQNSIIKQIKDMGLKNKIVTLS